MKENLKCAVLEKMNLNGKEKLFFQSNLLCHYQVNTQTFFFWASPRPTPHCHPYVLQNGVARSFIVGFGAAKDHATILHPSMDLSEMNPCKIVVRIMPPFSSMF